MSSPTRLLARLILIATLALGALASPAHAAAPPHWTISSVSNPTNFTAGAKTDQYIIVATNTGATATTGPVTISDSLPAGLTPTFIRPFNPLTEEILDCEPLPAVSCRTEQRIDPGGQLIVIVRLSVDPGAQGVLENHASVQGGGAPPATASHLTTVSLNTPPFGFDPAGLTAAFSSPQAGAHPDFTTSFVVNSNAPNSPAGTLRDVGFDLPPGLLGNPGATPGRCPAADFAHSPAECPLDTAIGIATPAIGRQGVTIFYPTLVYSLIPRPGEPAAIGFDTKGLGPVRLDTSLPATGGYHVHVSAEAATEIALLEGTTITLWGVPADHNGPGPDRDFNLDFFGEPGAGPRRPFLTNPTSCTGSPLISSLQADSWQSPGARLPNGTPDLSDPNWVTADLESAPVVECSALAFKPSIEALPTTNQAESPSGLDFHLNIPQNEDADGRATAHLRDATVKLPAGMTLSSAAAGGLGACSAAQIGLGSNDPAACPDASVIGSVKVTTPLLEEPLGGQVFLGQPDCAPCSPQDAAEGKLVKLYIQAEGSGVRVKLPGTGTIDPATGQITTSFKENPQLPFEDLELHLFGGDRAPLATPNACGTFTTTSDLKPWSAPESGPDAEPSSDFEVTSGPGGQPCPSANPGLHPTFSAGTLTATAATTSPFVLRFARPDGQAEITSLKTVLPPGLSAYLRGIPYCPDADIAKMARNSGTAEQANPSCPAASQIGTTTAGVGPGPSPFYVSGPVFLAGPYKGAPLSVVVDTPAVAGPFDLGTVAVRAALYVDPQSAQVTAVSDPIPTSLDGIPLRLRDDRIELTRPDFTLNPTDCDPLSVGGTLLGTAGATAELSSPFQVSGCQSLPFKPKLALRLKGSVRRTANPKLIATLTAKPGEANIARAQVKLPAAALLDNAHIGTICTRPAFATRTCPPGSIYGRAMAVTPLLDQPLEGNVYLEADPAHKLPDLVADLDGQIRVALAGKTDSVRAALRNTFEAVPDAPVSSFRLELFGGKRGLIQMSDGFCAHPRASVKLTAHDNSVHDTEPVVASSCPHSRHRARAHRGARR